MTTTSQQDRQRLATAQKAYAASKPVNATPSRTIVNSTTKGLYTGAGRVGQVI